MISILFYSSIGSFLIHQVIFYYVDTFPNKWIVYGCLATSVWNHGTTSRLAQVFNRSMGSIFYAWNIFQHEFYPFSFKKILINFFHNKEK